MQLLCLLQGTVGRHRRYAWLTQRHHYLLPLVPLHAWPPSLKRTCAAAHWLRYAYDYLGRAAAPSAATSFYFHARGQAWTGCGQDAAGGMCVRGDEGHCGAGVPLARQDGPRLPPAYRRRATGGHACQAQRRGLAPFMPLPSVFCFPGALLLPGAAGLRSWRRDRIMW